MTEYCLLTSVPIASIVRNFVRVSSGPEQGSYYHEFFLRDKPHLVAQMFCKNARSKMAMAESSNQDVIKGASPSGPVMESIAAPSHQQIVGPSQQQVFSLDIPLALLESLVKPPDQQQQPFLAGSNPVTQPGLLLQQQQYANLLLERQIQLLQQEQAKHVLHLLAQDSKPAASAVPEDQRLLQMQQIVQSNQQQRTKGSPTNHRASAA